MIVPPSYTDKQYEIMIEYHAPHSAHWGLSEQLNLLNCIDSRRVKNGSLCDMMYANSLKAAYVVKRCNTLFPLLQYSMCTVIPQTNDKNRHGHYKSITRGHQR